MIVVTGGAGFIGSNLLAALEKTGQKIACVDILGRDDKWRNIAQRHSLFDFIKPEDTLDFLWAEADAIKAVVHLGAISSTTETDVDLILAHNLQFSQQLWQWCCENERPFIYASSAATYGDGKQGFSDDNSLEHLKRLRPLNPYGWSKHQFDLFIAHEVANGKATPPQYAGLKFFNVYGPNEYHKGGQRSVAHQLFPVAAAGQTFSLFKSDNPNYADGGQERDFVYVEDCVAVMLWLLNNRQVSGLFNVGCGAATSFKVLAESAYQALGLSPNISYRDMPEALRGKYQYHTKADLTRLRAAGYSAPFLTVPQGVARYYQDYLTKANPYV